MSDLAVVDSQPLPNLTLAKSEPLPASPKSSSWLDSVSNFARNAWGELAQQGQGMVDAAQHPIEAVKAIGASQDALRVKAEDAFKRGDYAEGMRHALSYVIPMLGPGIDARGDQAQRGDVSGALGGAATIGLETAAGGVSPETVAGGLERAAATTKAATQAVTPTASRVADATGAAGLAVLEKGSLIHPFKVIPDMVRAAYQSWQASDPGAMAQAARNTYLDAVARESTGKRFNNLTRAQQSQVVSYADQLPQIAREEMQRAVAGKTPLRPPMAEANAAPPTGTYSAAGGGQPLRPPLAQKLQNAIENFNADSAAPQAAENPPTPAQTATTVSEPTPAAVTPPAKPSLAQVEARMAQKAPPPMESPQSPYFAEGGDPATGGRKSPQYRAMEIQNANRLAKAQRFAQFLHDEGVKPQDLMSIPMGHFTQAQVDAGASYGWGNIAELMGEKAPSADTVHVIQQELGKLAKSAPKAEAPATPPAATPVVSKNAKAAEIAKKLRDEMLRSGTINE